MQKRQDPSPRDGRAGTLDGAQESRPAGTVQEPLAGQRTLPRGRTTTSRSRQPGETLPFRPTSPFCPAEMVPGRPVSVRARRRLSRTRRHWTKAVWEAIC
jgi:hypothetical protein